MRARKQMAIAVLRAFVLVCVCVASSCDHGDAPAPLPRTGPLGSLRDLVLYMRTDAAGGPFFLDLFEVTRADFAGFAASKEGLACGAAMPRLRDEQQDLPMAGVDLRMARAFAAWRRCRLMSAEEWAFVCTTDGRDAFPWGSRQDPSRANTSDLGAFSPLPVGTFESGRPQSGPYDLIGNVAEWTETVPVAWFGSERDPLPAAAFARAQVADTPGLAIWSAAPGVFPPLFVVEAAGDAAPREAVGSDFAGPMAETRELRAPSDSGDRIGLRLAATPREVIEGLGEDVVALAGVDAKLLARFCGKKGHADALRIALAHARISAQSRARWLKELR